MFYTEPALDTCKPCNCTGHSTNMQWEGGQTTSPLPFLLVSFWLFLFLISRQFRIKQFVYESEQLVQWMQRAPGRAGLRGRQREQLPRALRFKGAPPWWHSFVLNKIFVWKLSWFKRDTKIQTLCYDVTLSITDDFFATLTFCQF